MNEQNQANTPETGENKAVERRIGEPLIEVQNLKKYFPIRRGLLSRVVAHVKAVDDISFTIGKGETLSLVGESGCGKTTAGRTMLRLYEPTAGKMMFEGKDVFDMTGQELRSLRRKMQIIFQDPYSSLNPRMTVEGIVGESLGVHGVAKGAERKDKVRDLLEAVGLDPVQHLSRYPHEFSGGQRQRIGVARAMALDPDFIVCDEAVSALDVSIQSQILNLLVRLREEHGFSYLFITHDLSVVEHISDRVAVMYVGELVEIAGRNELYKSPMHPYTQALLSAIPIPDPKQMRERKRIKLEGDVPTPVNPPKGCRFHPRCQKFMKGTCDVERPPKIDLGNGHGVRCHLYTKDGKVIEE